MKRAAQGIAIALLLLAGTIALATTDAPSDERDNGLIGKIVEAEQARDALSPEEAEAQREIDLFRALDDQLRGFDSRDFDGLLQSAPDEIRSLWGDRGVDALIRDMASGAESAAIDDIGMTALALFRRAFLEQMGLVFALLALAIVAALLQQVKSAFSAGVSDMAGFVCYAMAMIVAVAAFSNLIAKTRDALSLMVETMEVVFPPLLVLLGASGAPVAAGLFQPATVLLSTGMTALNQNFFLPLFLAMGALAIVGNISENTSLHHLQKLMQSTAKWSIGGISTIYLGIVTLRGISAKTQDGLSLRAARYALDKFVPYVGSLLSGSTDAAFGAAMVFKNGLGICAMIALFGLLTLPLLRIVALQIAFRVASAAVEALGDTRLAKGLDALASTLSYLFAIAAVQALMFAITIALIMGAGIQ